MEVETNIKPSEKIKIAEPSVEHLRQREVWDTADFESYILSVGELSSDKLPKEIWLNEKWHGLIRRTAELTEKDGRERGLFWAKIEPRQLGVAEPKLFCFGPRVGTTSETPLPRVGRKRVRNLERKLGYRVKWPSIVGDSHTHPRESSFSSGDLTGFLFGWEKFCLMTTKSYLLMLMRSSETKTPPVRKGASLREMIEGIEEILEHAVKLIREEFRKDPFTDQTESLKWNQARLKVAESLAEWSNSALYGGEPGRALSRLR